MLRARGNASRASGASCAAGASVLSCRSRGRLMRPANAARMASGATGIRACEPSGERTHPGGTRPACAHRNRPLRYDGRVVVTLCADEVLYLPASTEITGLPQLTRGASATCAGTPGRRADADGQGCGELEAHGEAVTSRALAATA